MKDNAVGKILRSRRIELNLTQRDIATYVGVTEATVSRWESGHIDNMRRDKIARLAEVLKISPLVIMGMENVHEESTTFRNQEEESRLLINYRELNLEGRNILRGVLKSLSNTYSATATM